ncbi:MAG: EAL domain-containing protein [Campylobacterota bacterium]|nr:EAL domain-containing protein [Campylobacterota bacterium]
MLRNKLFIIIVSILSITLLTSGFIYFKDINDIFNIQIQKDIKRDKDQLKHYISKTQTNLLNVIDEISLNDDLISSLNLISLYEDPKNYIKETFDYEKNNLIELSNKWIKESSHYSISLFTKDFELIMLNRKLDKDILLGYISYDEDGKKQFLNYKTKKTIPTPVINKITKNSVYRIQLNFFIERFLISYLKPIYLDQNIVGYAQITTCVDSKELVSINKSLNLDTIFVDQNSNYLFPTLKIEEKYKQLGKTDDINIVKSELLNFDNQLFAISLIDKTIINEKINNVLFSIIEICFLLLILIFAISAYFINRSILQPINNLKDTIYNIKENKPLNISNTQSKDEISQIVKEFNNLSMDLSKNIAFLESYEIAMDESSIVSKADLKGNITYVNENFCKITGYTKQEVLGKPHNIVRDPNNSSETFKELWETIKNKKVWKGVLKNKGKLGHYWVDITILPILDENKNIVEYIAVRHDITQMIKQQKELDNIANTDILTQLGNRYKLIEDIKQSKSPALAILNIDNFSQLNDFYGHQIGDQIIKEVGSKLLSLIKNDHSFLYHLQGDEYVLFSKNTGKEIFIETVRKLNQNMSELTIDIKGENLFFNFTTAISCEPKDDILKTADMALKVAKKQNISFLIYGDDISLNNEYENNIKWATKIKKAIQNDKIVPVFQPIVNNNTNKWEKYESLVRLDDNETLVSPYHFLDISKKIKRYNQITKIMIEKSFEKFKDKDVEFSINLTIEDILNNDIKTFIFTNLEIYQIGSKVVFEIVESESINNFDDISDFIKDVKGYGCKIAIDDFGTGYSNFEYLMKLKADFIKIDGSMIKDIDSSENAQMVVSTIVDFAKKMNMKTIAEFVENESVLNKVKELGIDYSQGYYFSKPKVEL